MKDNNRNEAGVKDSSKTYRKGGWEQYTDFAGSPDDPRTLAEAHDLATAKRFVEEVCKKEQPTLEFKIQKVYPEGFYRIYSRS